MDARSLTEHLSADMAEVEARLRAATSHVEDMIAGPTSHLAAAGGKRLRPALTLLSAHLGNGVNDQVLEAAVSVELTHLATLYHDDVMDSAAMRRGAPAVHEVWGNSVAILAGDLLFARASQIVAGLGPEAVRMHALTFERLCLGQLHETFGPEEHQDAIDHYLGVLADKTGSLIATSARYGAMFGGAGGAVVNVMERYGEKVGVAFQLADDVLDLASESDTSGKVPGTDLREGVDTMPVLLLRYHQAAGQLDEEGQAILALLGADLADDAALADAVERLRVHPVVEQTRAMARDWATGAIAELEALDAGEVPALLRDFALQLVDRLA